MSGTASERPPETETGAYLERDDQRTRIEYDSGGVPAYVAVAWVVFIATYILVMSTLALPDLLAWVRQ